MFRSTRPLHLLRSVVCLILLGVAVTFLFRPALIVAGVLLPFALVGALTWGAYRLCRGIVRRARRGRSRIGAVEEVATVVPPPTRPSSQEPPALAACEVIEERREPVDLPARIEEPPAPRRLRSMARTAFHVGVEVGCGAALGAALSVLADWQFGTGIEFPAMGVAIGAVVGFVVGGEATSVQTA
jgi:hypothetical protein